MRRLFAALLATSLVLTAAAQESSTRPAVPPAGTPPPPAANATPAPGTAPPSATTVGFMHAIHATRDVATTLGFYTDVLGLSAEIRPFANPGVPLLTNSPGVTLKVAMLQIPGHGFNFELTEFSNVERHGAQPDVVDPGAPHMKFIVRDLSYVVAALARRNAPVVTRSHAPVNVSTSLGDVDAIVFRDPDGYLVEAIEMPGANEAPGSNVQGSIMGVTVADLDASLAFWQDQLGFELEGDPAFSSDAAMLDLMGLKPGAGFRTAEGVVPGSRARIQLIEFRGTSRKPFDLRVPDPGASGMALRVATIDKLLPRLKSHGVRIVSQNGALVKWSPTIRNVFVKDPNGLNLELVGEVAAPVKH